VHCLPIISTETSTLLLHHQCTTDDSAITRTRPCACMWWCICSQCPCGRGVVVMLCYSGLLSGSVLIVDTSLGFQYYLLGPYIHICYTTRLFLNYLREILHNISFSFSDVLRYSGLVMALRALIPTLPQMRIIAVIVISLSFLFGLPHFRDFSILSFYSSGSPGYLVA
jgi:hypothetical protein